MPPPRLALRWCWAASALLAASCAPPGRSFEAQVGRVVLDCAEGQVLSVDGHDCLNDGPVDCPGGSAAFRGESGCAPVGARCAPPLQTDPSGYGCVDLTSTTACTGAFREAVDSAGCVPIGDCSAPFPPANATLFVDDDFTAAQLDATHFRSIEAAVVAAAPDAVIAIEAGTYAENIVDPSVPMTLQGRCAEKVLLTNAGGGQVGLYAFHTQGVVARGLTISGHPGGVMAEGGFITLEDSVVEGNLAVGVFAKSGGHVIVRRSRLSGTRFVAGGELGAGAVANTQATLTLEDTAVTGNDHRGVTVGAGSTLTATRCVIARQRRINNAAPPAGALVTASTAHFELCAVADNDGADLYFDGAQGSVVTSVIRQSHGTLATNSGLGLRVVAGSTLALDDVTLADHPAMGVYAAGAGTVLTVQHTTVRQPLSVASLEVGRGLQVVDGARLQATSLAIFQAASAGLAFQSGGLGTVDHLAVNVVREIGWPNSTVLYGGFGVLCEQGSAATIAHAVVQRATLSAVQVTQAATLALSDSVAADTQLSTLGQTGCGAQVARMGHLTAQNVGFYRSLANGLVVATSGIVELGACTVADTVKDSAGGFGHALAVFSGGVASLIDTSLLRSEGIALVSDGAQARVVGGLFQGNSVALQVQDGAFLVESDAPDALKTGEVRVSTSTRFVDNQTRLGVGIVPIPPAP